MTETSINLCSMRPAPNSPNGKAWEEGARQGALWAQEYYTSVLKKRPHSIGFGHDFSGWDAWVQHKFGDQIAAMNAKHGTPRYDNFCVFKSPNTACKNMTPNERQRQMDKSLMEMSNKEFQEILNSITPIQIDVMKSLFAAIAAGTVIRIANKNSNITPIGIAVEVSQTIHSIKM